MRRLFIAEKPSLARAIADVLPQPRRLGNYIECGSDVVAWCAGHILELADADAYDPDFKQWKLEHLPISPSEWRLTVKVPELLETIDSLLSRVDVVVNAGDPDREGQLLVDEVLYFLGYRGAVERVLISDLNPAAVRKALGALQPNANFRRLYDAALGRQRADWLYGINMTRLYTVLGRAAGYQGGVLSVGRVQTPLLGLIVRRDLDIEKFVAQPYFSIVATVAGAADPFAASWRPSGGDHSALDEEGRLVSSALADAIARKIAGQPATVTKATRERKAEPAPLPYSLSDLQIDAGRKRGLSPKAVLDACQALYETHRLVTYPRSDCSYLPEGHLVQAPEVVRAVAAVVPELGGAAAGAELSIRSRAWNDGKITAHHAIVPTPLASTSWALTKDELAVYDLIARRYLAQFFPPHEYHQLETELTVAGERLVARGRQSVAPGWRHLYETLPDDDHAGGKDPAAPAEDDVDPHSPIPPLKTGQVLHIAKTRTVANKTKPPRRFTAASLVQAMTGIARYVSDLRIKALLRETDGIGTPATQAAIIQLLFDRKYIEERKRQIYSTPTARALIRALPAVATQPDMTALWESTLRKVQEGQAPLDGFLAAVCAQLGDLVTGAKRSGLLNLPGAEARPCASPGCEGLMRKRQGTHGEFWSCSQYPVCSSTEPVDRAGANTVRPAKTRTSNRRRGGALR